ncbi:tyrosine-protein kinase transmembrane receptor Ror-like isoform X2 [Ischnura elegans]|uniref:tyrosine-protein kinase transmembrane receptor Ror-like isoform X2 n=1 Tax=Ischnura elegans TaxID=197161 RepID=UPI001ED8BB0B|nr:tyrosine-protein kinase transmembrane receptor Ror-like isoform X2 [Ischnura elegans]
MARERVGRRRQAPERNERGAESKTWPLGEGGGGAAVVGCAGGCGREAACRHFPNNTYACVCTHDSSPPTPDLRCPNRRTVPPIKSPPPVLPPTFVHGNVASAPAHKVDKGSSDAASWGGAAAALLALLFIFVGIWWWWTRRGRKDQRKGPASPVNVGTLQSDGMTIQYSASLPQATDATVPLIPKDSLLFLQEIGEGCFGKVYRGELKNSCRHKFLPGSTCPAHNGTQATSQRSQSNCTGGPLIVAVKVLKESASREAEEDFMREVEIMSAFQHENILSLIGVVVQDNGHSPWMVFEFMPFGDLAEVLRSNSRELWKPVPGLPPLTKASLLSVCIQIACGMSYLSAQRFVHRDLACRNCLVGADLTVKIADFGMSRDVYTCDYYKIGGSRMLPVRWMSPESVMFGRFTLESDTWSYGVVLWEIYSFGKQPYYGHCNEEVVKLILQGIMLIPPDNCPPAVCNLMRDCWKTEPKDRPSFAGLHSQLLEVWETMYSGESGKDGSGIRDHSRSNGMSGKSFSSSSAPLPPSLPPTVIELLDPDNYLLPHNSCPNGYPQGETMNSSTKFPYITPPQPLYPEYFQPIPD